MGERVEKLKAAGVRFEALVKKQLLLDEDTSKISGDVLAKARLLFHSMEAPFKKVDDVEDNGLSDEAHVKALIPAAKECEQASKKHLEGLEKLIAAQKKLKPAQKDTITRGLKIARTEVLALVTGLPSRIKDLQMTLKNDATRKKALQIQEYDERKAALAKIQAKEAVEAFAVRLRSALTKTQASLQVYKAAPGAATYNKIFPDAARNITQVLGGLRNAREQGVKSSAMKIPDQLFDELVRFGNGDRSNVADNLQLNQVNDLIAEFKDLVRQTIELAGKIAKGL